MNESVNKNIKFSPMKIKGAHELSPIEQFLLNPYVMSSLLIIQCLVVFLSVDYLYRGTVLPLKPLFMLIIVLTILVFCNVYILASGVNSLRLCIRDLISYNRNIIDIYKDVCEDLESSRNSCTKLQAEIEVKEMLIKDLSRELRALGSAANPKPVKKSVKKKTP